MLIPKIIVLCHQQSQGNSEVISAPGNIACLFCLRMEGFHFSNQHLTSASQFSLMPCRVPPLLGHGLEAIQGLIALQVHCTFPSNRMGAECSLNARNSGERYPGLIWPPWRSCLLQLSSVSIPGNLDFRSSVAVQVQSGFGAFFI